MKRILGLDLGVASIGWAYLLLDESQPDNSSILNAGVRIVPLSTDENDEFTKGNAISKNRARTLKRSLRRGQHRYKLRKHLLRQALEPLGLLPDAALFALPALDLYALRDRAVRERISLPELGRLWFHLNQKRGYRDSRKGGQAEEEKESDYLGKIRERHRLLRAQGQTVGQHLYDLVQADPLARLKQRIFYRQDYEAEFDQIWETQQPHYPDVLTGAFRRRVRDFIIYYHRPLKSQKGLVGECQFERLTVTDKKTGKTREMGYKVAPRSSPLFQVCRLWQDVNKVDVYHKKVTRIALTLAQKQDLFEYLTHNVRLSKSDLLKRLGYLGRDYTVNVDSHLTGNVTRLKLAEAFEKAGVSRPDLLDFTLPVRTTEFTDRETGEVTQYPIVDSACERLPHYQLWHLLHSEDQPTRIAAVLERNFGFTAEQAQVVSNVSLIQDFSNLSARAIRRLIPYLQQGMLYSDACEAAGYNHSASLTTAENEARPLAERLTILPKNSLRQPVVEKIVNQTINLVNAMLADPELGRPDEVRVELARELKQNIKQRQNTQKNMAERERDNKKYIDILQKEYGLTRVPRRILERYRLWIEQNKQSPYTGRPIEFGEVIRGGGYDVDHIIPQSRLFDDSLNNRVLVEREENDAKGDLTAYEFMQTKGAGALQGYLERVQNFPKGKRAKLLTPSEGYEFPDDFIERQLRQTQYITKTVKSLLGQVCRTVTVTSGTVTDYLRETWGLEDVMQNLNFDEYERAGRVEEIWGKDQHGNPKKFLRIKDWSKREDHRHHAVDSIVIAATSQSIIQKLNTLNADYQTRRQVWEKSRRFPLPWPTFIVEAYRAIDGILVSFKAGKRVAVRSKNKKTGQVTIAPRGFLHKETVYGRINFHGSESEFQDDYFVPLTPRFNPALLPNVTKPHIRQLLAERLAQFGNDPKKAFSKLDQNPIWFDAAQTRQLVKVPVYQTEFVVRYTLDGNFKAADAEYIVDEGVKRVVKERLARFGNDPKKAFREEAGLIWMNEAKGICVKSVRCRSGYNDLEPLHVSVEGKTLPNHARRMNPDAQPVDFVVTRNNHHLAVYRGTDGKLRDEMVTLWTAVERKQQDLPIIWQHHPELGELVISLQLNELFVFNLTSEELDEAVANENHRLIGKNLFRVQKMTKKASGGLDLYFRRHTETSVSDEAPKKSEESGEETESGETLSRRLGKVIIVKSLANLTGIKVRLDTLGRITRVGA